MVMPDDGLTAKPRKNNKGCKKVQYTAEQHRLAFETWVRTRRWSDVAKSISDLPSSVLTVKKWSKKNFRCRWGCSWHGWADLQKVLPKDVKPKKPPQKPLSLVPNAQPVSFEEDFPYPDLPAPVLDLPSTGLDIPVDAADDSESELLKSALANPGAAVAQIAKTTIERLHHLEYIYAKTMYFMTSIPVPCEMLRNHATGEMLSDKQLAQRYRQGSAPNSYEQAAKLLVSISREVQLLKRELGVFSQNRSNAETAKGEFKKLPELTINELVVIRDLLDVATTEQQTVLSKLLIQSASAAAGVPLQPETTLEEPMSEIMFPLDGDVNE